MSRPARGVRGWARCESLAAVAASCGRSGDGAAAPATSVVVPLRSPAPAATLAAIVSTSDENDRVRIDDHHVASLGALARCDREAVLARVGALGRLADRGPDDGALALSLGLCALHLRRFPEAIDHLGRAVRLRPEVACANYYYALALIGGRSVRMLSLAEARRAVQALDAALRLDDTVAVFDLLAAIIKRDYFATNALRIAGSSPEHHMQRAASRARDAAENAALLQLVVPRDEGLAAWLHG